MAHTKVKWKQNFEKHNINKLYIAHEQITDSHIAYAFVDPNGKYAPEMGIVIYNLTENKEYWENDGKIDPDELHNVFCDILQEYCLDLDELYR